VKPWQHLDVVVEHVVAPREIILNDLMTFSCINGSSPMPMSFKTLILSSVVRVVGTHMIILPQFDLNPN